MTPFARALAAFKNTQIGFDELLQLTKNLSQHSDTDIALALTQLESGYRSGSLPQAIYFALQQELSDRTLIASAQNALDDKTMIASPETDDATIAAPKAIEGNDTPTLVQATNPPTLSNTTLNTESLLKGLSDNQPYTELSVGCTLKNRFVLQELIGKGGMGMVFKATDLRKVEAADKEPFVALKVLSQDFKNNPMALVALQRETKRAQTLSHPHIINVYDFDRDGQHVFMTMEYLEGQPLSRLIKEHPDGLPFKKAWPIIHAVADALRYAHLKNIVHSDFKPGNVFIDESGDVRVLDFGIACAIGRNEKEHSDATIFDARALGAATPAYASLEQLQNCPPDPRDDIYALACVAYELLTGKHPFGRLSAEKALELNIQPKPAGKLPRRKWKALQRALALQQAQRTPTVDEFLRTLAPRSAVFYGLWVTGVIMTGAIAANVYFSMNAPTRLIEEPKIAVKLTPEQQQKINDLLELASIHADVGYLTAPTGSNALWAYREVLKIDPYNKAATKGIIHISDLMEQQAWEAFENGDKTTALKKTQDGLEANPNHEGLRKLRDKLNAAN